MSDYNLTIFDLVEGKEYRRGSDDVEGGFRYRRRANGLQIFDNEFDQWDWADASDYRGYFREIKKKKKLYAYLKQYNDCARHLCFYEKEHAQNAVRMPEHDIEIEE